eukprot:CAMPEP_0183548518 /NCGR_PEP_ID=MMETSP0371-20130417/59908_1 /TAXON_ID=268820 /ORGANISM="Peridinium aciculiferum, Strain PAER-2" /LENGTH=59 /DNA_ID=CAMNT_0025751897 /DNA_START=355 /DNA_END=534 /DNA_ORIENTATION=-
MWFRQMAQLSTTMSQAHSATALHFLISKRFSPPTPGSSEDEAMAVEVARAHSEQPRVEA